LDTRHDDVLRDRRLRHAADRHDQVDVLAVGEVAGDRAERRRGERLRQRAGPALVRVDLHRRSRAVRVDVHVGADDRRTVLIGDPPCG
jgi:hypothetical protein